MSAPFTIKTRKHWKAEQSWFFFHVFISPHLPSSLLSAHSHSVTECVGAETFIFSHHSASQMFQSLIHTRQHKVARFTAFPMQNAGVAAAARPTRSTNGLHSALSPAAGPHGSHAQWTAQDVVGIELGEISRIYSNPDTEIKNKQASLVK